MLALRGVARLTPLAKDRSPEQIGQLLARAMPLASRPEEIKGLLGALSNVPSAAGLNAAVGCLQNPAVKTEAALTVLTIAGKLDMRHEKEINAAIERVKAVCGDAAILARSETIPVGENLALVKAVNLDGLKPDGQSGPPQAAIDGDPRTYWDETDNQKLYWLRVTLKAPATVTGIRIMGYSHQHYAPRELRDPLRRETGEKDRRRCTTITCSA